MASNRIEKVAVVGASGRVGKFVAEALLKTGKHQITAITRGTGPNNIPEGMSQKTVDYSNESTLVEALRGQDMLVITMSAFAPKDQVSKLVRAAAEAEVQWIIPNDWGYDSGIQLAKESLLGDGNHKIRDEILSLGKSSYIIVSPGFWYEWSLAIPGAYGLDIKNHKVTFIDDGETKLNTSTWPQCGRAVAALLNLPIAAEGEGPCLSDFRNKHIHVSSFLVSQKDIFESVLRVTNTQSENWTISHQGHRERYDQGVERMKAGDITGFQQGLYTRYFYPDGSGDVESKHGLQNDVLGLPKEDIDEATRIAVHRAENDLMYS